MGVLMIATLREYLIKQGNNPKKVEQIQEKSYSFRSYLTRHYSLNRIDQHLDLANYLISMLYRFPFPLTADVMLQDIQKIVDSTKRILAENNDTDSNAISEFNPAGNSQPASVPATIANIIISEGDQGHLHHPARSLRRKLIFIHKSRIKQMQAIMNRLLLRLIQR